MNSATVSALVIRLFSAYNLFYVCEDAFYLLAKQATDPSYNNYHFTACLMGVRVFLAVVMYMLAIPLGKRIAKGLFEPVE